MAPKKKKTKKSVKKKVKKVASKVEEPKKLDAKAVKAFLLKEGRVMTENSNEARDFYNQSRFGQLLDDGKVQLSLIESLYLMEKGKLILLDGRNKQVSTESFLKKAEKFEAFYWRRYCVYKDIRNRGYIVKTALKFGADFRVYDRGVKPGEDHAKWILYPVHESAPHTWQEFSSKNRVAHSTRKRLLIGVVDEENDVTYYEIKWTRP